MTSPVATSTASAAVRPSEIEGELSASVSVGCSADGPAPVAAPDTAHAAAAAARRNATRLIGSTVDGNRDGAPPPSPRLRGRGHPEVDDVPPDRRADIG